jgi:hypothetical protein
VSSLSPSFITRPFSVCLHARPPVYSWRPAALSFGGAPPPPPRSSALKFELEEEDEGPRIDGGSDDQRGQPRQRRRLGAVYFDLTPRPHKFGGAAHFVVRCGKLAHEYDGGLERALGVPPAVDSRSGVQLPIVVLVASLGSGGSGAHAVDPEAVTLSPSEVETLFHEAGHALHSLLSRTEFQHLHGGWRERARGRGLVQREAHGTSAGAAWGRKRTRHGCGAGRRAGRTAAGPQAP